MSQYGPPGGSPPYGTPQGYPGRPGFGPGPKQPRETGALWVCVALLAVAIVGCVIAGFSINNGSDASASAVPVAPGAYASGAGGGVAPEGGVESTSNGSSSSGRSASEVFPAYPGSKEVASAKPYLLPGGTYYRSGVRNYIAHAKVATVFNWYRAHLAAHNLSLYNPLLQHDYRTHRITSVDAPLNRNDPPAVLGNVMIEAGKNGLTVVIAQLYG